MRLKLAVLILVGLGWFGGLGALAEFGAVSEDRIIELDMNGSRGVVRFNHNSHEAVLNPAPDVRHKASAAAACSGCHHTTGPTGVPQLWKCTLCHRGKGDPANPRNTDYDELHRERAFHDKCIGCHRAGNETTTSRKAPVTCGGCHAR